MNEEISAYEFYAYEQVRVSGMTNMFDVEMVKKLSGLPRERILIIIKNYGVLKTKFTKEKEMKK
jgi:hypothetical protein